MYGKRFRFTNRAIGGTPTSGSLVQIPSLVGLDSSSGEPASSLAEFDVPRDRRLSSPADFVLIDFSVNDFHDDSDWRGHGRDDVALSKVAAATESLLRFLLSERPALAILVFEGSCRTDLRPSRLAHERVALHYGVPFLAYSDVLPPGGCSGERWMMTSRSGTHPGYQTHQLLAYVLAVWWQAALASLQSTAHAPTFSRDAVATTRPALSSPLAHVTLRERFAICASTAGSQYDAATHKLAGREPRSLVRVKAGNWSLFADRPGKPGWISEGQTGAAIGFDLRFGGNPRATVVYEQGYEGFGDAEVTMADRSRARQFLRGLRVDGEHVTQAQTLIIPSALLRPWSRETLWVQTVSEAKVKIRLVSSC